MRYLKGASDFGIIYVRYGDNSFLIYIDSNYNERILFNGKDLQAPKREGKVILGWGTFLAGDLISWSLKRQYYVTTLIIKVEYIR